jgi:hypothetical protein
MHCSIYLGIYWWNTSSRWQSKNNKKPNILISFWPIWHCSSWNLKRNQIGEKNIDNWSNQSAKLDPLPVLWNKEDHYQSFDQVKFHQVDSFYFFFFFFVILILFIKIMFRVLIVIVILMNTLLNDICLCKNLFYFVYNLGLI